MTVREYTSAKSSPADQRLSTLEAHADRGEKPDGGSAADVDSRVQASEQLLREVGRSRLQLARVMIDRQRVPDAAEDVERRARKGDVGSDVEDQAIALDRFPRGGPRLAVRGCADRVDIDPVVTPGGSDPQ